MRDSIAQAAPKDYGSPPTVRGSRLAHIVVVTHEFDSFAFRRSPWGPQLSDYLLFEVLRAIEPYGHTWTVASGSSTRSLRGDVGILHVDSTKVDLDYLSLDRHFELAINFGASDVSKRAISGALLPRPSDWPGQVIIKSNLNYMGHPEARQNHLAGKRRKHAPHPGLAPVESYLILPSRDGVPQAVWGDESRVVERFIPEEAGQGFALRSWLFMGRQERCVRHISYEPIVKPAGVVSSASVEVPNSLREQRLRLGFEFGKFDFVLHDGQAVLLHANRTPPAASNLGPTLSRNPDQLAEGLDHLIVSSMGVGRVRRPSETQTLPNQKTSSLGRTVAAFRALKPTRRTR